MNLQKIRNAISDPSKKVISFDVFDTMVVRPFWQPSDLFFLLNCEADRLLDIPDACDFSTLRVEAEEEARIAARMEHREDTTLQEIYDCLEKTGLFPTETVQQLMEQEVKLEIRFCTARKTIKELVEYAISLGKTVIAASDMYLSSSVIGEILKKSGYPKLSKIYVSGEIGMTKGSGKMFQHITEELDVHPNEMLHIGDQAVSDVSAPRKLGIKAFHFPRTIDRLEGKRGIRRDRAFKEAYQQINSSFAGNLAMSQMGIRCMLATAANLIYDNPFPKNGMGIASCATNPIILGTFALGMYCMAHALWIGRLTEEETYDHVLFFARDGFLIQKGYELLRGYRRDLPESSYAYTSRKAMFSVLIADRKALPSTGFNILYKHHSPKTIVNILETALKSDPEAIRERMGGQWNRTFESELSMLRFLRDILDHDLDEQKIADSAEGFRKYFEPYSESSVLTYDVGYNMRQESLLGSTFPRMKITACGTCISGNLAESRGRKTGIRIRSLYPFSPYVTGFPRELLQSENGPSCEGYSRDGHPVLQKDYRENELLTRIHQYAIHYMETFTGLFQEDILQLPMDYVLACLPFETFLHRPRLLANRWIRELDFRDSFTWGMRKENGYDDWRRMQIHYWCARKHVGKWGKRAVFFAVLLFTHPVSFQRILNLRVLPRFKRLFKIGKRE